ncbi:MAG TPA: right-handed parallel beta-helix repeat-containing protein [Verrucomicrobiaceae bacterium]|jgi:serine/threonine protein kinase
MADETKQPFNLDDIDFGPTIRGHQKGDRVFDRFVLQKLLGRGGMGVVWLAQDERLGREVALKFAPEVIRYDEIAVEELKEETRKGLGLAHPNIVRIYDFLLDEDHAAISMEFIDGENLGTLRTRQPCKVFEPEQIKPWVAQMLDALDYAHRGAKVIHRDLKPANLMVDREGNLRVTDFGIARSISDALDRATLGRASTGTLAYMSPQQASGKKPHISDDIYAFGSTLYELVTGKPPFYTGNLSEQLRNEPVMPPSDRRREFNITGGDPIPVDWEHTILACLEKEVENRPANAHAVMERLGLAAPARQTGETPAVMPGSATAVGFSHGQPTGQTAAYIRPGAGLTEIAAPSRPLTVSRVRVAGSVVNPPVAETPQPIPVQIPTERKAGAAKKWITALVSLWLLAILGAGGWYGFDYWNKSHESSPRDVTTAPPKTAAPEPDIEPVVAKEPAKDAKSSPPPVETPSTPPPALPPQPPLPDTTIAAKLAKAKAGDTVTITAGTYEESVQFKDGVKLRAAENGKVIVQVNAKSGSALRVDKCATGSISGFVFQHLGTETAESDAAPVAQITSSSITIEDCTFQKGAGSGMEINGAGRPTLTRVTLANNGKDGLLLASGTTAQIIQCTAQKNGASGIDVRHSGTAPVLTGNTSSDNADSGIVVKDGASASILENTRCNINGEAGIAAAGEGSSVTIAGANCDGNRHGISIQKGAVARINSCTVINSKEMGIHFGGAGSGSEIRDTTIEKSDVYGMLLAGGAGSSVTIIGNKIINNALTGILATGEGFRPIIEKNDCNGNGEYGIGIAEGASAVVRGNTVRGNNRGGIGQQNAAKDLLIENNIVAEDDAAK